jgi:adenosylcobinamide-phosphate synthase
LSLNYLNCLAVCHLLVAQVFASVSSESPLYAAIVLLLAALLDYGIGDPWNWLHPVQVMGWIINRYCQFCFNHIQRPALLRLAGIVLTVGLISLSGFTAWLMIRVADELHPVLGLITAVILLASCFAGRSLRNAARNVLSPLTSGDLATARSQLSRYVGRDTERLNASEILRAVLETVTENATDGVMAPLFYAMLGSVLPIGSAPVAIAYKAASTLDSMVGYRKAPYTDLGWCSARLEDVLTWVPCRLHVLTLALLSGKSDQVWRLCQRDAVKDPSPNSGWSECAYAAILGVQVGGVNYYQGVAKHKPLLGDALQSITSSTIQQALALTRLSFLVWLAVMLMSCFFKLSIFKLT